jgi:hypothetical protein
MKFASSAPTQSQNKALQRLIRAARADNGSVGWVITDGTSGATKTGTSKP